MSISQKQPSPARTAAANRRGVEKEYWLLLLLIALIYTTRMASPPVRGEESRRATVTIYFLESGNYIVPQQQGSALYMSARPPLQNWLMLPFYTILGGMGAVAIRLPSILAVFATSSLLYFYGRCWMSHAGAWTAALAFATMLQVMELGRTAETDLVLTAFVTAGLLGWHYFYETRKRPARAWLLGYAAVALATLTKGLQAPVYFFAATFLYLCWTGRGRAFFDKRHGFGLCLYALMVAAWLVPYYCMTGREGVRHVFTGDIGIDKTETMAGIATHIASFPFILLACMLPWSVLFLLYFRKSVRAQCGRLSQPLGFAAIAFCGALPTVWLMPGSKTRFLLNMFPCAALCVGMAVECALAAAEKERAENGSMAVRHDLLRFTRLIAGLAFLGALLIFGIGLWAAVKKVELPLAMSLPRAVLFAIVSTVLGWLILRNRGQANRQTYAASLFCVAAFFGWFYNFPMVDEMNRLSQRTDLAFAELYEKQLIPNHRTLVSLDECPHLINYLHFLQHHATIPKVTLAQMQEMQRTNDVYFVSDSEKFPLPHTVIARWPMLRYHRTSGWAKMAVIGKIPCQTNQCEVPDKMPVLPPAKSLRHPTGDDSG
jgi:4-amino-4-deoxy-L-arabinose transferase-like glycosyltransferase